MRHDELVRQELSSSALALNFLAQRANETQQEKGFNKTYDQVSELVAWANTHHDAGKISEQRKDWFLELAEDYRRSIIFTKLFLAVSELAEAGEDVRDEDIDWDHFGEEIADTIIRLIGGSAQLGINIGERVVTKMERNEDRPYMHGRAA